MENIVSIIFKVESEGYQALSEMENATANDVLSIMQATLVKKTDNQLSVLDGFNAMPDGEDGMVTGSLIGGLIGLLMGPLGMLLGMSTGMLIGSSVNNAEELDSASLIEWVSQQLTDGDVAIIARVHEENPILLDSMLEKFTEIDMIRQDAAEVSAEVQHAEDVQYEMEKEARKRFREERKENLKQHVEEHREKVQADFDEFKKKIDE